MQKKILKLFIFILFIFFADKTFACDDFCWDYILKNKTTGEYKAFSVYTAFWDGYFNEANDFRIGEDKGIPKGNYFEHWDVIGYVYEMENVRRSCKINDGEIIIDEEKNVFIPPEGDKCSLTIHKISDTLELKDLTLLDKIRYFVDLIIYLAQTLIFGSIFIFMLIFQVIAIIFNKLKSKKPLYSIILAIILALSTQAILIFFGFSKIQLRSMGFLFYTFIGLCLTPFYILGCCYFDNYINLRIKLFGKGFLGRLPILITETIFCVFILIAQIPIYNIFDYNTSIVIILLTIIGLVQLIRNRYRINSYIENTKIIKDGSSLIKP